MRRWFWLALYAVAAMGGLWLGASSFDWDAEAPVSASTRGDDHEGLSGAPDAAPRELAQLWRRTAPVPAEGAERAPRAAPFDEDYLRAQLGEVRLRSDGRVQLDGTARKALERLLDDDRLVLMPADLARVQAIIREAVPGPAGLQTADVVAGYYRYVQAKRRLAETTGPLDPEAALERYDALVALREQALGRDVSDKLFFRADRDARFMMESTALAARTELSEEERAEAQRRLAERYDQDAPPIEDWSSRRDAFYAASAQIDAADGLEPADRQAARAALAARRFDEDERAILVDWSIDLAADPAG